MKELDLLVENYFTESFETSDLLRLVEQVMLQEGFDIPIATDDDVDNFNTQYKDELKSLLSYLTSIGATDIPIAGNPEGKFKIRNQKGNESKIKDWTESNTPNLKYAFGQGSVGGKALRISNKGDVVEGLLGVALFISLRDGIVTKQRIIDTLKALDEQKKTSKSKKKISSALKSLSSAKRAPKKPDGKGGYEPVISVKLEVALNIGNFKDLVSEEKRGLLESEYNNVLKYSNSDAWKNIRDTVIFDRANPPRDSVEVSVIGALEQTTSKADLRLFKDGKPLSAQSLKYSSRQLGQVGGRDVEKVFAWLSKIFDTQLPQNVKDQYSDVLASECDDKFKERLYRATSAMFAVIYKDAKGKLSSNDYQEELLKALKASSVGNEPNIDLLNFEKNKFRLLNFAQIGQLSDYLNLDIDFRPAPDIIPDKGGYPMLTVFDPRQSIIPNDESKLFTVRPKYEANKCYPRFYLEYGDLVDNVLTKVNESKLKE
jgi:hypothetical protein